jgi:DNA repair protein RadC
MPRTKQEKRNIQSDAYLIASLVCDDPASIKATLPTIRAALRTKGLASLARDAVATWPRELAVNDVLARRLTAALELGKRLRGGGAPVSRPDDIFLMCADLRTEQREHFTALYLNARHQVMKRHTVSIGTLTASLVHPREVFGPALRLRAAAVVVVHNHPSGDPEPSPEDCALTERLKEGAKLLGVDLLDHVVVASGGYVSFRERGAL